MTLSARGLNLMIGWILARFALGIGTGILFSLVERPREPAWLLLVGQDILWLGMTAWFLLAVIELSRGASVGRHRSAARYGAAATLAFAMSAGLYTHGVLALDAPRGLFVPSPLVGDLAAVCSIVAWYGVIGLVGRSSEALGLRGPRGLGMAGLGLLTLSVLGGLVDSALRVRRLYWVTHPDRHENPLADQILLAAHEPLQQLLPAVGTLIGWIGLLAILVVLVWLRGRTPQGRIVAAKLHG